MPSTVAKMLEADSEPIPGYRLRRCIGKGGAGEVWEVEAPGQILKAMKVTATDHMGDTLARRELEGLQKIRAIRHPFLLAIDRFEVVDGFLIVVTELADRSLAERQSECRRSGKPGIPRDELLGYLSEAAEVLDLLSQEHGLQHLDVKPTNLLLSSGHLKVADFGLVQPRNSDMSHTMLAFSPGYAPPEVFDGKIELSADQYSLAVTYQELLCGDRPYSSTNIVELACLQRDDPPNLSKLPADDQIILRRALNPDCLKRFDSCRQFISALKDAANYAKSITESKLQLHGGRRGDTPAKRQSEERSLSRSGLIIHSKPRPLLGGAATASPSSERASPSAERAVPSAERAVPRIKPVVPKMDDEPVADGDVVRATFLASLPVEIYALKLRAFIDLMDAEIVNVSEQHTLLRLRPRGWLGMRSSKAIFLKLDAFRRSRSSEFSVMDVTVWSTIAKLKQTELTTRASLLIRCLKAFLMATDENAKFTFEPAVVKSQLWG